MQKGEALDFICTEIEFLLIQHNSRNIFIYTNIRSFDKTFLLISTNMCVCINGKNVCAPLVMNPYFVIINIVFYARLTF